MLYNGFTHGKAPKGTFYKAYPTPPRRYIMCDSVYVLLLLVWTNRLVFFENPPPLFRNPCQKIFCTLLLRYTVNNLRKDMTLNLMPELGVPLEDEAKQIALPIRTAALAKTVAELENHGLDTTPDEADKEVAAILATSYAQEPDKTSRKVTNKRAAKLTPPSVKMAGAIIDEFNHSVVESSKQLRNLVTNKLIIESENPDPRVRMRALELMGKISDVGLFTEKSEVTITHQTTDDLREKLRGKLAKLVNPEPEVEDAVVLTPQNLDANEEFGFDDDD
jgi:hypothetical protein